MSERAGIQGSTNLVVGAASAINSLSSGELRANAGYGAANAIGVGVLLIILIVAALRMASAVNLVQE